LAVGAVGHPSEAIEAQAASEIRSVLLDGVGHYAAQEAPQRVADALLEFAAGIDAV
jgi:pimeloyl-ACP methyl ester carboxylesterase